MEEIKKEEQVEVKEVKVEHNFDNQFKDLSSKFDKLLKENEILKKEVLSLKESGVIVSPEKKEIKKHTVNKELWKETF